MSAGRVTVWAPSKKDLVRLADRAKAADRGGDGVRLKLTARRAGVEVSAETAARLAARHRDLSGRVKKKRR